MPDQRFETNGREKDRQDKQDVVCTVGQDVTDADRDVQAGGRHEAALVAQLIQDGCQLGLAQFTFGTVHLRQGSTQCRVHAVLSGHTEFVLGVTENQSGCKQQ